ncbi:MAG TPA: trypsin-like peptidase domain-containing protein [Jatrophihabitantaceae bacterium]|nr:trypsin-like peptidase domain-containing protein [Jatrophihabitantaceae bacterium]
MTDQGPDSADVPSASAGEERDPFAPPPGVDAPFARPDDDVAPYTPPPRTVSPEERATFRAPPSAGAFAPQPGERLPPRHTPPPPVPQVLTEAFASTPTAQGGFDPVPGTRIAPAGSAPGSPWWKSDAQRDPWRDPAASFWLGRGAIFSGGDPEQVLPDDDVEYQDVEPPEEPATDEAQGGKGWRGRPGYLAILFLALVGVAAGALGGGIGYWLAGNTDDALHRSDVSLGKTSKPANRPPGSIADIAKRVRPAVVSISVTTSSEYAVGSGVVVDKHGYVLTNNHVVSAAANGNGTIVVTFADEATAKARIVGLDPASDLAVLKVPTTELTVAALGDSDKLAVGDPVIAIGSPLALQGTVTEGIVSALNRAVHIPDDQGGAGVYIDAIQTDAAINHGNSGGALVDASGAVVGINSAAALQVPNGTGGSTSVTGIGFAIPINYARGIAEQLIRSGKAVHASLGVQGRTATANDGLEQGAYLEQVVAGGPAAKAGLRPGDVVVAAGGKAVPSYDQLVVVVQNHKPGDAITVTYYRGAGKHTARVTLGSD